MNLSRVKNLRAAALVVVAGAVAALWFWPRTHDWGWTSMDVARLTYEPSVHVLTRWQAGDLEYSVRVDAGREFGREVSGLGLVCQDKDGFTLVESLIEHSSSRNG